MTVPIPRETIICDPLRNGKPHMSPDKKRAVAVMGLCQAIFMVHCTGVEEMAELDIWYRRVDLCQCLNQHTRCGTGGTRKKTRYPTLVMDTAFSAGDIFSWQRLSMGPVKHGIACDNVSGHITNLCCGHKLSCSLNMTPYPDSSVNAPTLQIKESVQPPSLSSSCRESYNCLSATCRGWN